jgi:hypothetical protein
VQKLHRDHQDQAYVISRLHQRLRQAKQATKKLQPVLRLLEDGEGETMPNQSLYYHRKNHNERFQQIVHAAIHCVIVHNANFCRWQDAHLSKVLACFLVSQLQVHYRLAQ